MLIRECATDRRDLPHLYREGACACGRPADDEIHRDLPIEQASAGLALVTEKGTPLPEGD